MIIQRTDSATSTRRFEPCPEGWVEAIIGDVVDLGILQTKFGAKRHLRFVWFVAMHDEEERPYRVLQQFPVSAHPQSNLMQAIEAIFDHPAPIPFDTETLIGARARIRVKHVRATSGKVYSNVVAITPSEKPLAEIPADYVRVCDRQERV